MSLLVVGLLYITEKDLDPGHPAEVEVAGRAASLGCLSWPVWDQHFWLRCLSKEISSGPRNLLNDMLIQKNNIF